ncbi:divergent polysaccharide deacetylase family protein [Pseudooceanicola sp. HF7]|uniref:divergent polysaccharide deacetylase family protein n=1 Tax=Pseudooceanicola sp. HF7 TaxID=2721560 RepID=UPI001430CDB4|nr:hypothetical protein [Pseudooceanicola sp. HF7]
MLRGTITGLIWGVVVAIGLLVVALGLLPYPQIGRSDAVEETAVDVPAEAAEPGAEQEIGEPESAAQSVEETAPGADAAEEAPQSDAAPVEVTEEAEEPAATAAPEGQPAPEAGEGPEADPQPEAVETPDKPPPAQPFPEPEPAENGLIRPEPQPDPEAGAQPEPDAQPTPDAPALPAIESNAMPFEGADGRPRMAVVLIDEGDATPALLNRLREFPHPLSIAIDPAQEGAAEAMARYREAGLEVLARGDAGQDWFAALPESVGLLEAAPGALQQGADGATALAARLSEQGYGLVLYPEGEDVARKIAEREGVPAATLFREFDGAGEDRALMRRFLDFGANLARPGNGVVMLGHLRPETLSALLVWGLTDRADGVALAPVSAVLTEGQAAQD